MGRPVDDDLSEQWLAVRAAVLSLASELPGEVVVVTEDLDDESLDIIPTRPGAPSVLLGNSTRDEVSWNVGGTGFWTFSEHGTLVDDVCHVLRNVMQYGFIQAGDRGRIPTGDGYLSVGTVSLIPWRWAWEKKTFLPFL